MIFVMVRGDWAGCYQYKSGDVQAPIFKKQTSLVATRKKEISRNKNKHLEYHDLLSELTRDLWFSTKNNLTKHQSSIHQWSFGSNSPPKDGVPKENTQKTRKF